MDLTTFNDHPNVFADDEDCNSPGEDVDTLMPFDAPEQATVLDSAGLGAGSGVTVGLWYWSKARQCVPERVRLWPLRNNLSTNGTVFML